MSYTTAALPKIPLSYGVQNDNQGGASMRGQVNPLEIQTGGAQCGTCGVSGDIGSYMCS